MDNTIDSQMSTESSERRHQTVSQCDAKSEYSIVVLDNGSYSIKAGWAGHASPTLIFQNCALQSFGRRDNRVTLDTNVASGSTSRSQNMHHTLGVSEKKVNSFFGDDIYTLSESLCQRPHSHGLLVNNDLEISIWEKLFSKNYLNITDPSSHGILVTEHCNTPTACRYALTQIIFEEFGFDRVVISPGQQLVPFAFSATPPPQTSSLEDTLEIGPLSKSKIKKGNSAKDFSSLQSWKIGDEVSTLTFNPLSHFCQMVVDVGHQTIWIVPLYKEMPIETAISRIDLGGAHASALLRQLLAYKQIDLEHHELLVHHIKEECCFVSLNYDADIRLCQKFFSTPPLYPSYGLSHLTHRYYLPNLNIKEKSVLKRFFKTTRRVHLPQYEFQKNTSFIDFSCFVPIKTAAVSFTELLKQQEKDINLLQQQHQGGKETGQDDKQGEDTDMAYGMPDSLNSDLYDAQAPIVYMNLERIKPAELFFSPSDYQLTSTVSKKPSSQKTTVTSSKSFVSVPYAEHDTLSMELLEPFKPETQCGIVEAIQRTIFSCPPVLQPYMSQKILLCGGSSCLPNFARRLYIELRSRLPEHWPICIHQQEFPSVTTWIGGSLWAGKLNSSNFHTFSLSRSQYFETG